jgi:hypothetical protein
MMHSKQDVALQNVHPTGMMPECQETTNGTEIEGEIEIERTFRAEGDRGEVLLVRISGNT